MSIEFEWSEGEDRRELTTLQRGRRGVRIRAILLTAVIAAAGLVWVRAQVGLRTARVDLQAVVDAEVAALRRGDKGVYMSLQDGSDAAWIRTQAARFDGVGNADLLGVEAQLAPLHVVRVDLHGPLAWVEVEYDLHGEPYRRVQFYRQLAGHWRRTAPDLRFWGEQRQAEAGHIRFIYHEAEEEIVRSVLDELERFHQDASSDVQLNSAIPSVVIEFVPSTEEQSVSYAQATHQIGSPLLLGIAADGPASRELSASLAHIVALQLAMERSGLHVRNANAGSNWVMLNGIASWLVAQRYPDHAVPSLWQRRWDEAAALDALAPLPVLWPPYSFRSTLESALAFVSARGLVDYAVQQGGPDTVPILLSGLGCELPLRETVQVMLGMGYRDFELGWRAFVQDRAVAATKEPQAQVLSWRSDLLKLGLAASSLAAGSFMPECIVSTDASCEAYTSRVACSMPFTGEWYYNTFQPGS